MQESVKQDRDKYIGGSDIPVIMNLSPFKSRYNLLLEKAGYREDDFTGNVYTEYGNTLEPLIREWINTDLKDKFVEGKHTREAEGDELIGVRIHTDGENKDAILEIKTTSQVYDSVNDYKLYLVQLLYYMVLTGKEYGYLAVYERPEDMSIEFNSSRLHLYKIAASEYSGLISDINEAIERFIEDLARVKANPFICAPGNESKFETLIADAQTAKDMGGSDLRDFLTKSLNMWVENTDDNLLVLTLCRAHKQRL